jgi:hypothetical protein
MDNDSKIKLVAVIAANILQDYNRERINNARDDERDFYKTNRAIAMADLIVDRTIEYVINYEGEKNHAEVS